MSAHTPGPWEAVDNSWQTTTVYADKQPIARLDVDEDSDGPVLDSFHANARLIAAAPRMYAVIEAGAKAGDAECLAIVEAVNGRS